MSPPLLPQPSWHLTDFAPLMGVYIIVFLYISFSVGELRTTFNMYPVCISERTAGYKILPGIPIFVPISS